MGLVRTGNGESIKDQRRGRTTKNYPLCGGKGGKGVGSCSLLEYLFKKLDVYG